MHFSHARQFKLTVWPSQARKKERKEQGKKRERNPEERQGKGRGGGGTGEIRKNERGKEGGEGRKAKTGKEKKSRHVLCRSRAKADRESNERIRLRTAAGRCTCARADPVMPRLAARCSRMVVADGATAIGPPATRRPTKLLPAHMLCALCRARAGEHNGWRDI